MSFSPTLGNRTTANQMLQFLFVRHAEREDHVNFDWQDHAVRIHDSPLSGLGYEQSDECGEFLSSKIGATSRVVCFSSPLVRCVTTAKQILLTMNKRNGLSIPINVEEGIAESNKYLRGRITGSHKTVKDIMKSTGQTRTNITVAPVLLCPNDLIATAHPIHINSQHETIHRVYFSEDYFELNSEGAKVETPERIKEFLEKLMAYLEETWDKTEDLTYIFVTHGGVLRCLVNSLVDQEMHESVVSVDYVQTVEITPVAGQNLTETPMSSLKFEVNDCWKAASAGDKPEELA